MLFNSYLFWCFFAVVLTIYWRLPHRAQNVTLLISSYIFYGYWDWRFLSLIVLTTLVDYCVALAMDRAPTPSRRRLLLLLSLATNLGLLGIFKYYTFFATELASLLGMFGWKASPVLLHVLLPAGISFYTFQEMSYTIDVYRRVAKPVRNLLDFAVFVCFFPQLMAGPIERWRQLGPQIQQPRVWREADFVEGLYHILLGLLKKIVIADNMSGLVTAVFTTVSRAISDGTTDQLNGAECFLGVLAFTFQIYGDFSGYSSMAQGIAKWLGFELMYNFKMPYFADSPSDFWRRWHISLSSWLRDYLYILLGGNRQGKLATLKNLMITMLLGGLWHGANWTFVAWGGYHGLLLCGYRLLGADDLQRRQPVWIKLPKVGLMFLLTMFGWLLFKATSLTQVEAVMRAIFRGWHDTFPTRYLLLMIVFFNLPMMLYEWTLHRHDDDLLWLLRQPWPARALVYLYIALMLLFFSPEVANEFIYFQF